jgi:RNA polymerase sigma-70 factor (ECF subfamily)
MRGSIRSIARSTCTDLIRKRSRQKINEQHYGESCAAEFALPKDRSVWELVGRLPQTLKEAVVLVYWEGVNHAHAAAILDCAESTVSWRVHEARKQLKGMLEECI